MPARRALRQPRGTAQVFTVAWALASARTIGRAAARFTRSSEAAAAGGTAQARSEHSAATGTPRLTATGTGLFRYCSGTF
jgi:hypothetical protein